MSKSGRSYVASAVDLYAALIGYQSLQSELNIKFVNQLKIWQAVWMNSVQNINPVSITCKPIRATGIQNTTDRLRKYIV